MGDRKQRVVIAYQAGMMPIHAGKYKGVFTHTGVISPDKYLGARKKKRKFSQLSYQHV